MSWSTRALTLDDVPRITAILGEAEAREPAEQHFDEDELREMLTGPGFDLERGSLGVLADDGELVAFGALGVRTPADVWGCALYGGVATAAVGRGIGTLLVDELTRRAVGLRDAHDPSLPGEVALWIPEGRRGFDALAQDTGFETWRWFFDMRCQLQGDAPPWAGADRDPDGVQIRTWRPEDDEDVRSASNESFADHWHSVPMDRARWRAEFAESSLFRPQYSHVAVLDGDVVAFVLVEEFPGETAVNGFRTGYVARVGTRRAARGRGVASATLARTLTVLLAAGHERAELTVDAESPTGAGRLYERLGFVQVRRNRMAGRRFPAADTPSGTAADASSSTAVRAAASDAAVSGDAGIDTAGRPLGDGVAAR
ncbi:GNAT family N-acetyltransferase [Nakamurella endophytica]|uniref:GNAT family N-acetyltransferase n=1 Tax=Nakamurella endophytica TaxID=1748367 RepID=UPI00166C336B|nr:GNAT family N-acetyltransferase [Nakamurella endophytica]